MNTLEVLRGMRELLSDPERWTKKVSARDTIGNEVGPLDTRATSFCLYGAAVRIVGEDDDRFTAAANSMRATDPGVTLGAPSVWQDQEGVTHLMVMAFLDRAIAAEEAKVQR